MASTHASSSTSPPPSPRCAFTTLVTTDEYLPAALVVAHSLRLAHETTSGKDDGFTGVKLGPWTSNKKSTATAASAEPPRSSNIDLVALVTPASLSIQSIRALLRVYDRVIGVEPLGIPSILAMRQQGQIASQDDDDAAASTTTSAADSAIVELSDANLSLLDRADLGASTGAALTKLHAWRLTDYAKVIYLDADTLVLRPLAHLFSHTANFAASSDTGWPDIFNSGVMLLTPSQATFEGLLNTAAQSGTWDGADQGLINEYFGGEVGSSLEGRGGGWVRLPFTYNMTALGGYTYAPAYRRYGAGASVAHFIGMQKPWRTTKPPSRGGTVARDLASGNLASKWWDVYASHYPLSGASTPVEGEVEVRFTEKGVEVIERPSAKGLDIPVYQAAWAENDDEGVQASSRSVDDLKALFQTSMGAARRGARVGEGRYESLPLFGRIDLLPPQLQKVIPAAQQKALAPSPPPQQQQQQQQQQPESTSGTTKRVAWDATVSSPPLDAAPSWRNAPETFYPNAWDQPSTPMTAAERAEIDRRRRLFLNPNLDDASSGGSAAARAFGYIPPEAKAIHDYQHLGGEKPDEGKVGKVFPWEKTPVKQREARPARSSPSSSGTAKQPRPAATRVFPEDSAISASPSSSQDRSYDRPEPLRRFDYPQQSQPQSPDLASSSGAGSGSMPVNLVERYSNVWDTLMPSLGRESEMVAQRRIASTQGREAAHEASLRGVTAQQQHGQQQGQRAAGGRKTSLRGGASRGAPSGGRDTTSTGLSSTDSGTNTGTGPHPRSRQSTAGGYTSGGGHLSAATATTAAGSRYYTAQSSSDNYTDADDDSIADQYVLNRQPGGEGRGYAEVEGSASWAVPHRSNRRRPKGEGGAAGGSTGTSPTGAGEGPHRRTAATRRSFSPPAEGGAAAISASSIPIPRRTSHRPRGLSEDDGDDESSDESDDAGNSTFQEAMSTLPATGTGELGSSPGTLAVPAHSHHHQREGPGYTRKAMASGYARTHATPRSPRHSSHNVLATVGVVGAVAPVAAEAGATTGAGADLSSSPGGAVAAAGAGAATPVQGGSPAAGAAPALPPLTGRARIRPEEGSVRRSGW